MTNKKIGVYIHIPFCEQKCPYCDFFSVKNDDDIMDLYTKKICEDIQVLSRLNLKADTLYFGGGTPNLLGETRLLKIISQVEKTFSIFETNNHELTIEMNPTHSQELNFKNLLRHGVNRLSFGLQSSNDYELNLLGRNHTSKDAYLSVMSAKNAGFDNISLDVLIGSVDQSLKSLLNSLKFCFDLDIKHLSSYILKIEPGTPFESRKNNLNIKDDDTVCDMYLTTCDTIESLGMSQYEISNFSMTGYRCKHNLKYWNAEEYIGIGPSAHSFLNGQRYYYKKSLREYMQGKNNVIYDGVGGDEVEYMLLRLRLNEGILYQKFKERFNYSVPTKYIDKALEYQKHGFTIVDDKHICLTKKGFLVSNEIITRILK